jgi:hypothetical protein
LADADGTPAFAVGLADDDTLLSTNPTITT